MVRVKRGVIKHKKRERLLKQTKGFRWRRKSTTRAAKEALLHAGVHAFRGRKEKKRTFRRLWQTRLNAAVREHGMNYSTFIAALKKENIALDRKVLAELAVHEPAVFDKILETIRS